MTPPDEGTLRELIGVLRGEVGGLGREIGQMRADNSQEHAAVIARLDKLEGKVEKLQSAGDRKLGRNALVNGVSLAIASLVGALGALFGSNT